MTITTTTHLNFHGEARAALGFYHSVFGGDIALTTYAQLGMPAGLPGSEHIVFGRVDSADGLHLMAYDSPGDPAPGAALPTRRENGMTLTTEPCFISVRGDSLAAITGYWEGLAEGGSIVEPLAASAWSAGFGMLTDRFGVTWVLDVAAAA